MGMCLSVDVGSVAKINAPPCVHCVGDTANSERCTGLICLSLRYRFPHAHYRL